jgi:hypothetical protein
MSRPTAAPAFFPYPHRTLDVVDRQEAHARMIAMEFEIEENPDVSNRLYRTLMHRANIAFMAALEKARAA